MMSKRTLKAVLVISLAFNLGVVATVAVGYVVRESASESRSVEDGKIPIDDHGREISKCIGLTGKQAKCFEDVMAGTNEDAAGIKAELEKERDDLFHLLQAAEPDKDAIMTKVDSISVLQGNLEKLLVKRLLDSRAVLEPEEDERLMYLIRCSMRPGCVGKTNCPYQNGKEGSE
jgi:Spy/CpxP family protein refolding chaperone